MAMTRQIMTWMARFAERQEARPLVGGQSVPGSRDLRDADQRNLSLERWHLLLLLMLLALPVLVKLQNNDFWAHAKVGEWMWQHRAIPRENLFVFTTPHYPWVNHSWLSAAFLYFIYRMGDIPAVQCFEYLCVALSFLILWKLWVRERNASGMALAAFSLAVATCQFRFQPRPELFSAVGMSFLLSFLVTYCAGQRKHLWSVPPLVVVWTNFHGGVLNGLAVFAVFWVAEAISTWQEWRRGKKGIGPHDVATRQLKHMTLVFAVSMLATVINPYGFHYYSSVAPGRIAMLRGYLLEWGPLVDFLPQLNAFTLSLMMLFTALTLASFVEMKPSLDSSGGTKRSLRLRVTPFHLTPFLLTVFATFLAWQALRHLWTATQILLAVTMMNLFVTRASIRRSVSMRRWNVAGVVVAACVGATLFYQNVSTSQRNGIGVDPSSVPLGLVRFMDANHITGRMFNTLGDSCYLTWKLCPAQKLFIDILNAYDASILAAAHQVLRGVPSPQVNIRRWNLDYAIFLEQEISSPFAIYLSRSPAWALVYWDGRSMLFLHRVQRFRDVIERHEYRLTNPSALGENVPADAVDAYLNEVRRSLRNPVKSPPLYVVAGNMFLQVGENVSAERCFSEAQRRDAFDVRAHLGLGICALRSRKPERAARHARWVLMLRPRTVEAWNLLGSAHRENRNLRKSAHAFRRGACLDKGNSFALRNLADVLESLGERDEMIRCLQQLVKNLPSDWDQRQRLALALLSAQRFREAERQLQIMLQQRPDSTPTMYALAVAKSRDARVAVGDIVTLLEQAIRIQPGLKNLILTDENFDRFRELPEFKKLLGRPQ